MLHSEGRHNFILGAKYIQNSTSKISTLFLLLIFKLKVFRVNSNCHQQEKITEHGLHCTKLVHVNNQVSKLQDENERMLHEQLSKLSIISEPFVSTSALLLLSFINVPRYG